MVRLLLLILQRLVAVLFDPFVGQPRVPGAVIVLQGKEWVFAPVTLGFIEDNAQRIDHFKDAGALDDGAVALTIDAATASLKRNYWFITRARVRSMLDVASFGPVMSACWGGNRWAAPGDGGQQPGEAPAPGK